MIPVLYSFGSLHVYSYGLSIVIGVLLSVFLMERQARQEKFPAPEAVMDLVFTVLIWGFLGARFFYVLQNFSYYSANPAKILAVWEGGLVFYGGAVFSVVGFWLTARKKQLPFWKALDFIAPYAALTHVFGRIGCFLNGCCYGKFCDLPWAVKFPEVVYKVHPTQLYEALFNLWLFSFLMKKKKQVKFEGQVALLYFMLYGFGRYLIEFLREPGWVWYGLTSNQWFGIGIVAIAFILFKIKQRQAA